MKPGDLRVSLIVSWLIVTALTVPVIAAPFLVPASELFALAPKCEWKAKYGRECVLCGMTTAFVRIAEGDLDGAQRANRGSVLLFAGMAANQVAGIVFGTRMLRSGSRRSGRRSVLCKS